MPKQASHAPSLKRLGVDKTNARIVGITAGAAFLVVFCLVASYSLFGQLTYQNKIIGTKKAAVEQLKKNLKARDSLVESYQSFANSPQNFIGGSSTGSGAKDGNNGRLVLDALPGKYDFPAFATSLEKIANDQKVEIEGITGTDEEASQTKKESGSPQPIQMPFQLQVSGDYAAVQRMVDALDHSIRPIQLQKMEISGNPGQVSLDVTGVSYYQPSKALEIKTKVVK